jgi:IstB-like ATP binding protein
LQIDLKNIQTKKGTKEIDFCSSYYLKGCAGAGKTTLALQMAKLWITKLNECIADVDESNYIHFINSVELIGLLRKGFGLGDEPSQKLFEKLKTIKFLILDDIGKEKLSDFVFEKMYELINYRQSNRLQTVFTSNFHLATITEMYGDSIVSRIIDLVTVDNIIEVESDTDRRLARQNSAKTDFNFLSQNKIITQSEDTYPLDIFETSFENTKTFDLYCDSKEKAGQKVIRHYSIHNIVNHEGLAKIKEVLKAKLSINS